MYKKVLQYTAIVGFFIVLTIIFTFPAILHLTDRVIGDGVDGYQSLGFQFIANQNLSKGLFPFQWTTLWRYPMGFDFSRGFDGILHAILGGFLLFVFRNPILVYNVTILTYLILNGILSFILFEYISNSLLLGLLGGTIYGLSFFPLARSVGHSNIMLVGVFPFFLFGMLKVIHSFSWKNICLFCVACFLVMISSLQFTVLAIIGTGILFLVVCICHTLFAKHLLGLFFIHKKKGFLILIVTTILFFMLFNSQIFALINKSFIFAQPITYSPSILDYFIPVNSYALLLSHFVSNGVRQIERTVFLGYVEPFLFICFILMSHIKRRVKSIIILFFFITIIFSLGAISLDSKLILPYGLLIHTLPFSAIPETGRYYVLFYLALTIGIVLFLKQYAENYKRFVWVTGAVFIFICIERLPYNFYLSPTLNESYTKVVRGTSARAVLDIPLLNQAHDILPIYYRKPIVSGYIHWSADTAESQVLLTDPAFQRFVCSSSGHKSDISNQDLNKRFINRLQRYGITTIVIHKNWRLQLPECKNVWTELPRVFPQYTHITNAKEGSLNLYEWTSNPLNYSWYFSSKGTLKLYLLHYKLSSYSEKNIDIQVNRKSIISKDWKFNKSNSPSFLSLWIGPPEKQYPYVIPTEPGTTINFIGFDNSPIQRFVTIQYSFVANNVSIQRKATYRQAPLHKIFEDNNTEVWELIR